MAISAIIFIMLGISIVGFCALSLGNPEMPDMGDEAESKLKRWHVKTSLVGGTLLVVGIALALLTEG